MVKEYIHEKVLIERLEQTKRERERERERVGIRRDGGSFAMVSFFGDILGENKASETI